MRLQTAALFALCLLQVGCGTHLPARKTSTRSISDSATGHSKRKVFRNSVLPGGVTSREELADRLKKDPAASAHYSGVKTLQMQPEEVKSGRLVHVSYRTKEGIFWTKKKVPLHPGEVLLTDGKDEVRARCGNRISEEAQEPQKEDEPSAAEMDEEEDSIATVLEPEPSEIKERALRMLADAAPGGENLLASANNSSVPDSAIGTPEGFLMTGALRGGLSPAARESSGGAGSGGSGGAGTGGGSSGAGGGGSGSGGDPGGSNGGSGSTGDATKGNQAPPRNPPNQPGSGGGFGPTPPGLPGEPSIPGIVPPPSPPIPSDPPVGPPPNPGGKTPTFNPPGGGPPSTPTGPLPPRTDSPHPGPGPGPPPKPPVNPPVEIPPLLLPPTDRDSAPTPEPTSVVLVAVAIGWAIARSARNAGRRRTPRPK